MFGSLVAVSCGRGNPSSAAASSTVVEPAIDEAKVANLTSVPIKVLKAESIGSSVINRFYWIRVQGYPAEDKLLDIAKAAIDGVIAANPNLYSSFTIHFASAEDILPGNEMKKCYANATFLPYGDWQKVGREPIDRYVNYQLTCSVVGQR